MSRTQLTPQNKSLILVSQKTPGLDQLMDKYPQFQWKIKDSSQSWGDLRTELQSAEALLTMLDDQIDKEFLSLTPKLKVVSNYAVGYNNIDVKTCTSRGIWVTHTPDVLTSATAELTWALIFAVMRLIPQADQLVRDGKFAGWSPDLFLGQSLEGKTLGVVGSGRIGSKVSQIATAFGLNAIPSPSTRDPDSNFNEEFRDFLASCDIVSLHCPLTPRTRHLMGEKQFLWMKPSAVLINTARGPICDEKALVEALNSNQIWGAGLDVFENEPKIEKGLFNHPRVVLLPHIGSATTHARTSMTQMAIGSIEQAIGSQKPRHVVPEQKES